MTLAIAPVYAALTALLFLALSFRVIFYRRANLISLGDNGDKALLKRMRAQANCAEYAPLALVLLVMIELSGAPAVIVHVAGSALVLGRYSHAFGLSSTPQKMIFRQIGMMLTLSMISLSSLGLLGSAIF